jgi:hypothetical protein
LDTFLECCFIEGGHFLVQATDADGKVLFGRVFPVRGQEISFQRELPVGEVTLHTWSVGCEPSGCAKAPNPRRPPPEGACSTVLTIEGDETARVEVREPTFFGEYCDVVVR